MNHRLALAGLTAASTFLMPATLVAAAAHGFDAAAAAEISASGATQDDALLTQADVIKGTMDITFNTRSNLDASGDLKAGSAAVGAKDVYKFDLTVANTTQFTGEITRQPNLYTKNLGRRKQDAALYYDVDLAVLNPKDLKQKRVVGKWVGTVPIDTASGAFNLGGGTAAQSPLRVQVDAVGRAPAFQDMFAGKLVGKAEQKESLAGYTFRRVVGKRTVEVVVQKSDPMKFDGTVLAKGPAESYPRTTVNGRLDYDYETGNWYTDGIRFSYNLNGQDVTDIVTGSIKWVEDADRASNGKGYYEFNLRFNEEQNRTATGEADAFADLADEDAFFAVDDSIPALTGRVAYVDTIPAGEDALPTASKVTYNLNANKLSKQQVMNFFKLWLLGIGPINDE